MDKDMEAEVMKIAAEAGLTDFRMIVCETFDLCSVVRFDDGRPPNHIFVDRPAGPFASREAELETYRGAVEELADYRKRQNTKALA